jgi:hypothetical protein
MRKGLLCLLAVWLIGVGHLSAQTQSAPQAAEDKSSPEKKDSTSASPGTDTLSESATVDIGPGRQYWIQADYLLWWVRSAPLPVPIVTTGDPTIGFKPNLANAVNTAGAIGQPGTRVLLGDSDVRFPGASGMRLTIGGWIHDDQRLGIEGSGLFLAQTSNHFTAASNSAGSPPLYFPIFSGIAGAERAIPIADPLRGFSGNVDAASTLQFWSSEGNVLCQFYRTPNVIVAMLAGFRYADLRESFTIHNTTTDLLFGNVTSLNDSFRTTNQFYGGQIGSRIAMQFDLISLEITGKLAVGSAHQFVDIGGTITQLGPNPLVPPGLGTFPGGLFAQPTNIGRHDANPLSVPFMVLPSLNAKLAFQLTDHIRAYAGYDFLYWNGVVRPGNQINHSVNLSQNAVLDPNGVGTLVGPAQPAPVINRSDFWAQGIQLGLEFRY